MAIDKRQLGQQMIAGGHTPSGAAITAATARNSGHRVTEQALMAAYAEDAEGIARLVVSQRMNHSEPRAYITLLQALGFPKDAVVPSPGQIDAALADFIFPIEDAPAPKASDEAAAINRAVQEAQAELRRAIDADRPQHVLRDLQDKVNAALRRYEEFHGKTS